MTAKPTKPKLHRESPHKKRHGLTIMGLLIWIGVVGVAVFVVVATVYILAYRSTATTVTFTVRQLPNRSIDYQTYSNLIYTDKGVFQNVDSLSFAKFRSSDVYNQMQVGHSYTCKVAGWRIGLLSWYKNIIDCDGFVYY